jgi:methyltransferase (TIGR00027 family)
VLLAARDPLHARLLPRGAEESLREFSQAAGVLTPWMLKLIENEWYQRKMMGMLANRWPGEMMRLTLRKRFVDDEVRDAIEDGVSQLLIVGAGFDTLGLRIAKAFADVRVVEVDAPATAGKRFAAIEKLQWHRANHEVVSANLGATPVCDVLNAVSGWSLSARTVVLAEGVFMYLSKKEVLAFLGEVCGHTGRGSRVVFSYLTADREGRPSMGKWSGLSRLSLKVIGEPLKWGVREGELQEFLEGAGYRLLGPAERYDFKERYLVPLEVDLPVGVIERFAIAEAI